MLSIAGIQIEFRRSYMPEIKAEIVEVSPRDGLQNEGAMLPTAAKVELIQRAVAAGIRRIEAVSFAHPKRVPQMADAEAVMAALPRGGASYIGLVMNLRGLERALAAGVSEINFVVVASETFSRRNQGASIDETLRTWSEVARQAHTAKVPTSVTIAASFGCPFEGEVPTKRVVDLARRIAEHHPGELALADTIGVASPRDVIDRITAVREAVPAISLRCHFHNTRNTGLANAYAAIESGVRVLDASLGGIGGCPFAPGATGNIATEDLAFMLHRMGISTGLDLHKLVETALWIETRLARPVPGALARAGLFPRTA
jgi:hydroxymethylglutaryl-CoA lyase